MEILLPYNHGHDDPLNRNTDNTLGKRNKVQTHKQWPRNQYTENYRDWTTQSLVDALEGNAVAGIATS